MHISLDEALRVAIVERLSIANPIAIVLVGSTAEGFSNSLSDIDVFAVQSEPQRNLPQPEFFEIGETTVDVEYLSVSEIESVLKRLIGVARIALTSPRDAAQLAEAEILLVHRLINGHYLAGDVLLKNVLGEEIRGALARALVARCTVFCTAAHLDMAGLLSEQRMLESLLAARRLADWAYLAYIAGRGKTNPSVKWRYRQLTLISKEHPQDRSLLEIYSQIMREDSARSDEEIRMIVRKSVWVSALVVPVAAAELAGRNVIDSAGEVAGAIALSPGAQMHWRTYARLVDGNPVLGRIGSPAEIILSWDGFLRSLVLLRPQSTTNGLEQAASFRPLGRSSADSIRQIFGSYGLLDLA